jgi:hypothetical protein
MKAAIRFLVHAIDAPYEGHLVGDRHLIVGLEGQRLEGQVVLVREAAHLSLGALPPGLPVGRGPQAKDQGLPLLVQKGEQTLHVSVMGRNVGEEVVQGGVNESADHILRAGPCRQASDILVLVA